VAASVARHDRVRIVEDELAAAEIKWLCGRMDFVVGTRMHSNIFALSCGVPTVAIAYQPKTEGIMSDLGLAECVVPIGGMELEELQRAFDLVVDRSAEIRRHLASMIPAIQEKALEAGRLIAEDFARREDRSKSQEAGL
jgi:colanic acid/amylovoran biosynthesis protein